MVAETPTREYTRLVPWSDDAEKGSLGAMILDPLRLIPAAMSVMGLEPYAFYDRKHQIVCDSLFRMMGEKHAVIDILTLSEELQRRDEIDQIGGAGYLDMLVDSVPTVAHGEYYLNIVRQKYILREIVSVSRGIVEQAMGDTEDGDKFLVQVPARYAEIIGKVNREPSNAEVLENTVSRWRELSASRESGDIQVIGLPLPWNDLNEWTCGLQPGLNIIAGRPGAGKTTLEQNICVYLADLGIPTARATLDLNQRRVLARMVSQKASVSLPKLNAGFAGQVDLNSVDEAKQIISQYPMYIKEAATDLRSLVTWVRMLKMQRDIQLATFDFIQLIRVSHTGTKSWDDYRTISYVSQSLKELSFELRIPIIALSQLNRENDRSNRSPKLSDMRGSGSLEQDASVVIFSYPEKKMENQDDHSRAHWVELAKQQDGRIGSMPMWMRPHYFRFDEAPPYFGREGLFLE
ncbi:MAG: replicative DNA helicase [Gammaproteobacteria bacterium]|nr:replicative DNA helicase [Gammaproteobacteria bacterium]